MENKIETRSVTPGRVRTYFADCLRIIRLGFPVLVSQLGTIVVGFADNIMVGHYSTDALASASFVNNIFNLPMLGAMGFSYGITPIVGALFTNGNREKIGRVFRAAAIANLVLALALMAVMAGVYLLLPHMGQPAYLLPVIRPYFLIFLAGMLPVCLFNAFAQWSYGIRNTAMPMWIMLGTNLLNILGNYILIFGHFGAPEMGLTGAGVSTLAARCLCAVTIVAIFFRASRYRDYALGFRRIALPGDFGTVVRMSWPVALQMSFETGAFSGCAIFCGWLGAIEMASFQIIVVVGMLGFCFYYAIGTATAVLVSNGAGASDARDMRAKAMAGYGVTLLMCAISCLGFSLFARNLIALFTEDAAVIAAACAVIFPLVLYQVADATQINFANSLRGTGNVKPMMWISLVSYVIVGIPSSYLLAFPLGLGLYGIVLSFSVSLFLAAGLYMTYFFRTVRKAEK